MAAMSPSLAARVNAVPHPANKISIGNNKINPDILFIMHLLKSYRLGLSQGFILLQPS